MLQYKLFLILLLFILILICCQGNLVLLHVLNLSEAGIHYTGVDDTFIIPEIKIKVLSRSVVKIIGVDICCSLTVVVCVN